VPDWHFGNKGKRKGALVTLRYVTLDFGKRIYIVYDALDSKCLSTYVSIGFSITIFGSLLDIESWLIGLKLASPF
jgi:hypothetical protein